VEEDDHLTVAKPDPATVVFREPDRVGGAEDGASGHGADRNDHLGT
jgi:hypothetical protein